MKKAILPLLCVVYLLVWLAIPRVIPEIYGSFCYIALCIVTCATVFSLKTEKNMHDKESFMENGISNNPVRTIVGVVSTILLLFLGSTVFIWSFAFAFFELVWVSILTISGMRNVTNRLNYAKNPTERRSLGLSGRIEWYTVLMMFLLIQRMIAGPFGYRLSFRMFIIILSFAVSACCLVYNNVNDKTAKEIFTMWGTCVLLSINAFLVINPLTYYRSTPEPHQYVVVDSIKGSSTVQLDNGRVISGYFHNDDIGEIGQIEFYTGWFDIDFFIE